MLHIETKHYKKITKTTARKLYNAGKTIAMLPCKMHPENLWQPPYHVSSVNNDNFETVCNCFRYYNCNYTETGKYISFYEVKQDL